MGDHLGYEFRPGSVQIEPGRAAFVDTTLRAASDHGGQGKQRPYTLNVQRSGAVPLSVDGTFVQRGFLPRWLATALSLGLAFGIAFVMIWLAYKPQVSSGAREKLVEAGSTALPGPSVSAPSAPKADASAAPLPEPQAPSVPAPPPAGGAASSGGSSTSGGGGASGGGGGSGGSGGVKPAPPVPGAVIIGKASDRCVDITGAQNGKGKDGTPLQLWDCAGSANQKWVFKSDGTVRALGLCMDVAWGSKDDGAVIQVANCSGNPAQQWVLSEYGDLVNPQANKCIDAKDNGTGNGTKLQLWTCSGTPNQKWRAQ